ncbi:MAG: hydrogenase iron-sulfur subunit [Dehalococcoidia bacterium]|nr:hydrogenase iron-sulfur subunit [Dehalococcoidia bacterium]
MSDSVMTEVAAVKIKEDNCSGCSTCIYVCPFEAIKKDKTTGKTVLEIEKCQVCGLCYSTCPAKAIDSLYYDVDSLTSYLEKAKQKYASDTLVVMCKGSAPDFTGVEKLFGLKSFVPLSVPCVGRVPEEIFLKAMLMGIQKMNVLACDTDYCRFEHGSAVTRRKIAGLNMLLEQLGYGKDAITFKRNSLKVTVDANSCIRCGNCVWFCPYQAAKLDSPGAVTFDLTLCRGCGLCVAMCPALALDLENWERQRISTIVSKMASEVKTPSVLVFRCQWAVFPSLDGMEPSANVRFIDMPCASRVDTSHVLEALQKGADGVLIAACSEEDCKQEKSSGKAKHSVDKLNEKLAQIGLKDKVQFCTVAPRFPDKFTRELEQFCAKIGGVKESR